MTIFIHNHPYEIFIPRGTAKIIIGTLPPPRFSLGKLKERDVDFCYGSCDGMLWPALEKIFKPKPKEEQPSLDHLKRRLMTIQTVETARCLDENILTTPRDADIGSMLGWGFPAYTGGAISYVEWRGLDNFRSDCKEMEELYGVRFKAPRNIQSLSESFYN